MEQLKLLGSVVLPDKKYNEKGLLSGHSADSSPIEFKNNLTTNAIAKALPLTGLNSVILQNILDGPFGDVHIVNNRPGNYLKSKIGNEGFFRQTDSGIYHKMGGESNYELGDEVDEATMKQLKKLGYTFEKI